jgi:hypothetical protein
MLALGIGRFEMEFKFTGEDVAKLAEKESIHLIHARKRLVKKEMIEKLLSDNSISKDIRFIIKWLILES